MEAKAVEAVREARPPAKLASIDAMRGVAILMVVLVHSIQKYGDQSTPVARGFGLGATGVQLFFVASAFTLSLSWFKRPGNVQGFFIRRVTRVAPMYWVGIALYFVLALAMHGAGSYKPKTVGANILLVHGLVPSAYNNVVPGGWSIGTEMMFYVLFGLVLWRLIYHAGWAVMALLVCSILSIWLVPVFNHGPVSDNSFAYCHIANQLPTFICGILMFHFWDRRTSWWLLALGFFGFGVLAGLAALGMLPESFVLVPIFTGGCFMCLGLMMKSGRFPEPLCSIGQRSYSIYVLHFLFTWVVFPSLLGAAWAPQAVAGIVTFLLSAGAAYLIAGLTWRFIESPMIKWGHRMAAAKSG